MSQLAIKGHSTRGKEVIEILEMLGGKNVTNYDGRNTKSFYFINNIIICSSYGSGKLLGIDCYTLEEFLEKFPYKVGDEVLNVQGTVMPCQIKGMYWDNDCVKYYCVGTIQKGECFDRTAEQLQPYKEQETMEEKLLQKTLHLEKAVMCTFLETVEGKQRLRIAMNKGFELKEENGNFFIYRKKVEYPKTYEECCEIMGISYPYIGGKEDGIGASTYRIKEVRALIQLLICRDAYWKIAGEQMELGKPWEPDWKNSEERRYCIVNIEGDINLPEKILTKWILKVTNKILVFPYEEMRDAFYENFKDLIEQCKELL